MAKIKKQYITSKPDYTLLNPDNPMLDREMFKTMHYIQHELMPKQLSKATVLYAKNHPDYDDKLIRLVSDCWMSSIGKYAHIVNQGGILPENYQVGFDRAMGELTQRAKMDH